MKIHIPINPQYLMRITFAQTLIACVALSLGHAHTGAGQEILDHVVTLKIENAELRQILVQLEKDTRAKFVYSPNRIEAHRKVSVVASNLKLSAVLSMLLAPLNISYRIINGHIMLRRNNEETAGPHRLAAHSSVQCVMDINMDRLLTGIVTDDTGETLPGVNVTIKGTQQGTATDVNGAFKLTVPDDNIVLVFSFIGFATQEISIRNQTYINVMLKADVKVLDEIVVVGYGSMRARNVTSAIASVKAETFAERPIYDVAQAMQGNAAGVSVTQPSGKPGAVMEVKIRGANSINSGTGPLYVVDGVQTYDISGINPADIADINILKDATSTAIYGVNGSAGVVLITTRRAKETKGQLSLNVYTGISRVVSTLDVLDLEQYKELMGEIRPSYLTVINSPKYAGIETNWRNEVFRTGTDQNYNVSYAKGIGKTRVLASAGYQAIKGIIRPAQFTRFSGKINADATLTRALKLQASLTGIRTDLDNTPDNISSARGGVLLSTFTTPPMLPVYAQDLAVRDAGKAGEMDGQFAMNPFQASWENPLAFSSSQDETGANRFMGNVGLEVTLIKGLTWKPGVTYDRTESRQDRYTDRYRTAYGRQAASGGAPTGAGSALSNPAITSLDTRVSALRSDITKNNYNIENTLTYIKAYNRSDINVLLGNSIQEFKNYRHGYAGNGFPAELREFDYDQAQTKAESVHESVVRYISLFGRVNFTMKDKYNFSGVFRTSGASQLARGNKWGLSPGLSAAWNISEESFMKDVSFVDEFKLRGGWGRTGNVSGIPPYSSYAIFRPDRILPDPVSYSISQFENTDLTWETTDDINMAVDIQLLDMLSLTVDTYHRKTRNLMLNIFFPFNASVPYQVNAGDLTNKGLEFTLGKTRVADKAFKWQSSFNISINRNNVDRIQYVNAFSLGFFERTTEYAARLTPGQPIGAFFGYKVDRVDPETGKLLFHDTNGDGKIDAGDRTFIGNPHPDFTFGFTNNFKFKNFYLDVLITGSEGNEVLNATRLDMESMIDFRNQSTHVLSRWRKPGDITNMPRVNDLESIVVSDRIVEDGSYTRIKALTLGYNFSNVFSIRGINLYMTAQNLFTVTGYTGFDPEVNAYSGSTSPTYGIDYGTYPQVKTFIVGMKANF